METIKSIRSNNTEVHNIRKLFWGEHVLDMLRNIILFLVANVAAASVIKLPLHMKQLFIVKEDVMTKT